MVSWIARYLSAYAIIGTFEDREEDRACIDQSAPSRTRTAAIATVRWHRRSGKYARLLAKIASIHPIMHRASLA